MIYLDTNVLVYAVGRPHPLRDQVQERLLTLQEPVVTSAEVLQELLHVFLPVGRTLELDAALTLATERMQVLPVEPEDVLTARELARTTPSLEARDLLHLALCLRHDVDELWTYDRALAAAFDARTGR